MSRRPMCLVFFAFLGGLCFAYTGAWPVGFFFSLVLLYCLLDSFYVLKKRKKPPGKREKGITLLLLLLTLSAALAGWIRTEQACHNAGWYEEMGLDGQTVEVSGIIYAKEWKENSFVLYLKETRILDGENLYSGNRILLRTYLEDSDSESEIQFLQQYKIGQKIEAEGKISYFDAARNPGNFDMQAYYQKKRIDFALNMQESRLIEDKSYFYRELLSYLKLKLKWVYIKYLSEEEYGLLSTMLLGDDSLLNEEVEVLYQKAGISHILAISGLHISIVGMFLYQFLRKRGLSYSLAGIASFFLVFSYGLMSGMALSSQRALIMFLLMLLANARGKAYDSLSALSFAGIFLLMINPLQLFTASFQLSFSAVAGAVLLPPCLKKTGLVRRITEESSVGENTGEKGEEDTGKGRETDSEEKRENEKKRAERIRSYKKGAVDSFLLCLSIQLATAPIVLYYFFELPLYSILVNLLILPLASALLTFGFLGGFAGLLNLRLGSLLLLPDKVILFFYHQVCSFFQELPYSSLVLGRPSARKILLYYLFLGAFFLRISIKNKETEEEQKGKENKKGKGAEKEKENRKGKRAEKEKEKREKKRRGKKKEKRPEKKMGKEFGGEEEKKEAKKKRDTGSVREATIFMVFFLSLFLLLKVRISAPLEISMVDVGQGDGILIRQRNEMTCFIDGGSTDVKKMGKYRLLPFLKSEGIGKIDCWFVSHTDADHISALEEALEEKYPVKKLIFAEGMVWDDKMEKLAELAKENHTEVYLMKKGTKLEKGVLSIEAVYPPDKNAFQDKNDASLLLLLTYQDFSMLFTGDISAETEKELLGKKMLQHVDVLKVAHHGSAGSSSADFLKAVQAKDALISAGVNNSYGHPTKETLERLEEAGCRIYRTDQEGMIRILVYEEGYRVTEFLEDDMID